MRHTRDQIQTDHGFTLIELLVAVAVLAILMVLATPSVQKLIRDSRVTSQTNEIVALINLARNEAIRRGIDANDSEEARLRLDAETSGWSGNVSVTGGVTAEGCPAGVIRCADNTNVLLTTDDDVLSFESRGFLRPFAVKTMCLKHTGDDNCAGTRQHVQIQVLGTGQVQTTNLACDATCPTG